MFKKSILLFFVLLSMVSFAQTEEAEKQLVKIFELCKAKNYSEAANYFLYEGEDAARNLKGTYNYKERKEKIAVDKIGKKIFALLDISDGYKIVSKSNHDKNGLKWTVFNVAFISGNQEIEGSFYMTKINNKYVLGSID